MFLSQTNFSLHYSDKINAYNRKIVLVIFSPTLFIVEPRNHSYAITFSVTRKPLITKHVIRSYFYTFMMMKNKLFLLVLTFFFFIFVCIFLFFSFLFCLFVRFIRFFFNLIICFC